MKQDTAALLEITQAKLDAEFARLAPLSAKVENLRAELRDLDQSRQSYPSDPTDLLQMMHDTNWRAWLRVKRRQLQTELARARAEYEAQRAATTRAFGRHEALKGLYEKEIAANRQKKARAAIAP